MISYSWANADAAELLHDELALRGFEVIHDRYTFVAGTRIAASMNDGVQRCDVFIPYLTRESLYLDKPADDPRPAVTGELLPALRRRRENLSPGRPDRPIILPLAHGLGDRTAAGDLLRRETGESFGSLWGPWLSQDTPGILQDEAANVAELALSALLKRDFSDTQIAEIAIATRGGIPPPQLLTIDATRLVGGDRRPGAATDWTRVMAAMQSVTTSLDSLRTGRDIRIGLACHLSAAYAAGRTFHQASRWRPSFDSRHGGTVPATSPAGSVLLGGFDQHSDAGDLLVDIDMLGHGVGELTDRLATDMPQLGGRLSLTVGTSADLNPIQIAASAYDAATRIRTAHASLRPHRIHLTMAVPAAFAALLGYHATALSSDVVVYEFDDNRYVPAVVVPSNTP